MSVIDKKPFIVQVLDTLEPAQTNLLKSLVDGLDLEVRFVSLVPNSPYLLNHNATGISKVKLEIPGAAAQSVYEGFLIQTDAYCVLVSYSGPQNQNLTLIDMHYVNGLWQNKIMGCELTIGEFRSELNDRIMGGDIIPNRNGVGGSGSYALSTKYKTIDDIKDAISGAGSFTVVDKNGNNITDAIADGDYDGISLANGDFDTNDSFVRVSFSNYLLINYVDYVSRRPNHTPTHTSSSVLISVSDFEDWTHIGDTIYVQEANVPDRWISKTSNTYIQFDMLEASSTIITVDDMTNISQEVLNSLRQGDVVSLVDTDNSNYQTFIAYEKTNLYIQLYSYCETAIEYYAYARSNASQDWSYDEHMTIPIGTGTALKIYSTQDITTLDYNILDVIKCGDVVREGNETYYATYVNASSQRYEFVNISLPSLTVYLYEQDAETGDTVFVDATTYTIPTSSGGVKLYRHSFTVKFTDLGDIAINIISTDPTPLTKDNLGYDNSKYFMYLPSFVTIYTRGLYQLGSYNVGGTEVLAVGYFFQETRMEKTLNYSNTSFTDTVTEL